MRYSTILQEGTMLLLSVSEPAVKASHFTQLPSW